VDESSWPLFLTQAEWLRMLDGSLKRPFFARHADGSMVYQQSVGGMGQEALMLDCIPGSLDEDWLLMVAVVINSILIVLPILIVY
jgi:hypothetical protein